MASRIPPRIYIISDTQSGAHSIAESLLHAIAPPGIEVFLQERSLLRRLDAVAAQREAPPQMVITDFSRPDQRIQLLERLGRAGWTTVALVPPDDANARSVCASAGIKLMLSKPQQPAGFSAFVDRLRALVESA